MIEIRKTDQYTKWFSALNDRNAKARIDIRIRRLQLGNPGDVKPVRDRVSEMRINYGPGYRVYFIDLNGQLIVLLGGGDKGSQDRDIKKAIQLSKTLEDRK
jgi:putative addiction module killer protein